MTDYKVTVEDVKALQRLVDRTYYLSLMSMSERGFPGHVKWMVKAPFGGITYSSEGQNIVEAVNKWLDKISKE